MPERSGNGVRLRALTESDIPAWYARATDAESADLAGDPVPASIAEGSAWLQRHRDRFRDGAAIRWCVDQPPEGHSVGTVGLVITSRERGIGELGIVIGRAHWRRGIGTAAARLALDFAFAELGLLEVHAEVLQRNPASVRLLEKLGFLRVGAVPAHASEDGEALFLYRLRPGAAGAA